MQAFDRPVAPSRERHAIGENPVGMLDHNGMRPFHARLQVGSSQIPEIGGSQAVRRVEKLGVHRVGSNRGSHLSFSGSTENVLGPVRAKRSLRATRLVSAETIDSRSSVTP